MFGLRRRGAALVLILLIFGANLVLWALAAWRVYRAEGEEMLVLHYNIDVGADYLAPRGQQFYLPAAGLFLGSVNLALAAWLRRRSALLGALLLLTAFLLQLLLLGGMLPLLFRGWEEPL